MASPTLHAVLGASSSARWLTCTPSARLCERLEKHLSKGESEFAAEGTKAHALGEAKIRNALYHADMMDTAKLSRMSPEELEAYEGINDFRYQALRNDLGDIPKDMEQATDSYCDVVMDKFLTARDSDPGAKLLLEQRLDYSKWVPSGFGTGDCIIISNQMLEVADLKFGKGVPVDAEGNPQLRLYALGAVAKYQMLYDFETVRYTIIQPRLDSVSEETVAVEDLLTWAGEFVAPRAKLAWEGEGEYVPGEHCRFCLAKSICTARVAEALKIFQFGLEAPGVIPDEMIPEILPTLETAESWIKDIRAYAENQALRGQKWKGYKLVRGKRPNRTWSDPDEVKAQLLRAGYGLEQFQETKMKSPGAVEDVLGKAAFRALLKDQVRQAEGRLHLVPESDKGVEYNAADADFSDLVGGGPE